MTNDLPARPRNEISTRATKPGYHAMFAINAAYQDVYVIRERMNGFGFQYHRLTIYCINA